MDKRTEDRGRPNTRKAARGPAARNVDPVAMDALWNEVEAFPASESQAALERPARGLCELLRADNVRWLAAVRVLHAPAASRDPLRGWRLRGSYDLVPDPQEYRDFIAWWFRSSNRVDPDFQIGLATHGIIAGAGTFQVHRLRDGWIPFSKFRRSDHFRLHYTKLGITDRIWVSVPLNADTESVFLIDRCGRAHFSASDAKIAASVLRRNRTFHCRLFLSHGLLIASRPLSPAARRVLAHLLTEMSEKEIAAALGRTAATTHKYVKTIYGQFGVNSRAALMSLWLGGA